MIHIITWSIYICNLLLSLLSKKSTNNSTALAARQTRNMKIRIPTAIRPFRLITADIRSLRQRYASDWTTLNQLIFASAVYVFFTNLLPGITFASDLYVLTGKSWGTIEVVLSTGLCGIVFALCVRNIEADILYIFAPPLPQLR